MVRIGLGAAPSRLGRNKPKNKIHIRPPAPLQLANSELRVRQLGDLDSAAAVVTRPGQGPSGALSRRYSPGRAARPGGPHGLGVRVDR